MKRFFTVVWVLLALSSGLLAQDVYSLPVKTIEGRLLDLSAYKGKKVLVYILPISASDSNFVKLVSFKQKWGDRIAVIGVPALEEGFKKGGENQLKNTYKDAGIDLVITEAMQVKKDAGAKQAPLFQWLTGKDQNRHFEADVRGVGHKFFLDEAGKLYAVIGPEFSLLAPGIDRILNKPLSPQQ